MSLSAGLQGLFIQMLDVLPGVRVNMVCGCGLLFFVLGLVKS